MSLVIYAILLLKSLKCLRTDRENRFWTISSEMKIRRILRAFGPRNGSVIRHVVITTEVSRIGSTRYDPSSCRAITSASYRRTRRTGSQL